MYLASVALFPKGLKMVPHTHTHVFSDVVDFNNFRREAILVFSRRSRFKSCSTLQTKNIFMYKLSGVKTLPQVIVVRIKWTMGEYCEPFWFSVGCVY